MIDAGYNFMPAESLMVICAALKLTKGMHPESLFFLAHALQRVMQVLVFSIAFGFVD